MVPIDTAIVSYAAWLYLVFLRARYYEVVKDLSWYTSDMHLTEEYPSVSGNGSTEPVVDLKGISWQWCQFQDCLMSRVARY